MSLSRFIRGAIGVTKATLGIDVAPASVVVGRRKECHRCPERVHGGVCRACGCAIKPKTMVDSEVCPKGRW